jgi:hypothetical protein
MPDITEPISDGISVLPETHSVHPSRIQNFATAIPGIPNDLAGASGAVEGKAVSTTKSQKLKLEKNKALKKEKRAKGEAKKSHKISLSHT